jgi:hypothetical protein
MKKTFVNIEEIEIEDIDQYRDTEFSELIRKIGQKSFEKGNGL